jgi:hypothetical protein
LDNYKAVRQILKKTENGFLASNQIPGKQSFYYNKEQKNSRRRYLRLYVQAFNSSKIAHQTMLQSEITFASILH